MVSILYILTNPRMRPASLITLMLIEELLSLTIVVTLGVMVYHEIGQQYSAILVTSFALLVMVMVFTVVASTDDRVFDHRSELKVFHECNYTDYRFPVKHKVKLCMVRLALIHVSLTFIILTWVIYAS